MFLTFAVLTTSSAFADELLFEDNFNRKEADDSKEQVGDGWWTNSKRRAKGIKQIDLKNNALTITTAKEADHAAVVKHDAPFDDGKVSMRFRLHDKRGMSVNFNDPKCTSSHAGHISQVRIRPDKLIIEDGKTGIFDTKIREKGKAGAPKEEIAKLTKGKSATSTAKVALNTWNELTIEVKGDVLKVLIDGEAAGSLTSEGLDHPVKQNLAFSVPGSADIDDLKIWSSDQ